MRSWQPWVSTAARAIVGPVFITAGVTKIGDLAASGRAVAAYRILPYHLATLLGAVQPFLEITLGALLLLGLATRLASVVISILLVMFLVGVISVWMRGLRIDCSCFGRGGDLAAGQKPQYFSETIRDIALLLLAGFLAAFPRSRYSLDARLLDGEKR